MLNMLKSFEIHQYWVNFVENHAPYTVLWKPECWMHIQDIYPLTGEIIHRQYLFKPNGIKRASHCKLSVYHPIAEFF
ncbi:hypothetical protein AUM99_16425 [Cronobacter sakazakii]|nr:hypothetical protein AUM99_16425 [Cronobacter sakazakii]